MAILTRFSKDQEYGDIVQAIETVDPEQDQTLEKWL